MPYAAKAKIEHEFDIDHLNVWVTFFWSMDVLHSPPLDLWILELDNVAVDVISSVWQDQFTLLLTSDTVIAAPNRVTLEYDGPSSLLQTTWGKDWEPWGPILSIDLESYQRPSFVDRGDPSANDFTQATLTADDAWHDLDLSGIVPAGAVAVYLKFVIIASSVNRYVLLRKKGNVNEYAAPTVRSVFANGINDASLIVALDTNQFCQYKLSNIVWTVIAVSVLGWFF